MKAIPYLYVDEEAAKALGCTHESTLFGVPGYSNEMGENSFEFIPKFYPATWFLQLCDKFLDFASYFTYDPLETPHVIIRKL